MNEAKAIIGITAEESNPTRSKGSTNSSRTSPATSNSGEPVQYRTMTIRVRDANEDYWNRTNEAVSRAWKTGEYQGEELTFSSLQQLFEVITQKRWELIDALQKIGPTSLRGLARQVHRDIKRVHQDVGVLLNEGIVERRDDGKIEIPFAVVRFYATIGTTAA